jgi:ATP-dependent protease HslVU (ClpYQ) peptidase subunit
MDMGTVLAVRKNGIICIAADSLTISGSSRKQTADYVVNCGKIIKCGPSYIGTASHSSWHATLKSYFNQKKKKPSLGTREEIFDELLNMHHILKEEYFLVPHENDEDQFESSRFESLIVNPHGIFKTYKLRSVQQFIHFIAIGTGASYALGALYALYDRLGSAEEIAKEALNVAAEFDDSSSLPGTFYTVKSK